MENQNFSITLKLNETPALVFNSINNVRGWWSEKIEGKTEKLNDEFSYHFENIHRSELKIIEFIPNTKVVWYVKDNYFKPGIFEAGSTHESAKNKFGIEKSEWVDTKISFEITEKDGKTELRFIHLGLVPNYLCFDVCSSGWSHYIGQSLFSLITTGVGQPNKTDEPQTDKEEKIKAFGKA